MADKSQKTEQPTASRRQKARREGQFPSSRDLVAASHLALGVTIAVMVGQTAIVRLEQLVLAFFARAFLPGSLNASDLIDVYRHLILPQFVYLLEKGAVLVVFTLLLQLVVTGFAFSTKQLTPKLDKLNFVPKLKQMPRQNFGSAMKALALLPVIGIVLYLEIFRHLPEVANLSAAPLGPGLMQARDMVESLLRRLIFALLVIGIIDFVRQKKRFIKDLKMTKQEVKDEMKEAQGDPEIKGRIRRLQREAMRRSMMKAIPKASAVIVNPTHYAIAIQYEMNSKAVPVVVAKGRNYLALAIRQKALEHEVPIIENKPLAQALYQAVDIGQEIPQHLYRAVAEVLAYIYRTLNRR